MALYGHYAWLPLLICRPQTAAAVRSVNVITPRLSINIDLVVTF